MRKIVVVGAGMVGHRFVQELLALDESHEVVLLGDEHHQPYNRVLLSEVVAGRAEVTGLALPALEGADVRLGSPVVDVDRRRRAVRTREGRTFEYDHLVLATGARARVAALPGLLDPEGELVGGTHVLRTVDDARAILAGSANARRVTVVGAGAIGLEVACGLRHRGVDVTLVASRDAVLDRELGDAGGRVAATTVRDTGVRLLARSTVSTVVQERGRITAVRLSDGRRLPTDLLVLSVGSIPETTLAARSGLATKGGVVVDTSLSTDDPSISAIGDCARTPQGTSGLVAQGWEQAGALARLLDRGETTPARSTTASAMRLKAVGMSAVSMGVRPEAAEPSDRVLTLDDSRARRHVDIVVRRGTLVGLTCVGAPDVAARLSTLLDRPGVIPADPLQLLTADPGELDVSPATLPATSTVCRCNGVSKGDVVAAWDAGHRGVDDIADATRATTGCGGCTTAVCSLIEWLQERAQDDATASSHVVGANREPSVSVG
ncbi:FAD-dependent oxidoreductase [Aeromicrobium sp. CTD01-1L150]|uniref:FAD-dependent oxidoreductase n=1 Tax=Aeromicrobium sp. CTD01-1L150 TaxID=3341830 RepID=UPI0035BF28B4